MLENPPEVADAPAQRQWLGAALGLTGAALPVVLLWGYTVDDALISARVAANIAAGRGHRFNADGDMVDAVTPLGWALLLAPFAGGGPLAALSAAQFLGAASWLAAAAWLGGHIAGRRGRLRGLLPLAVLAGCSPIAAWAVSGMETGVVTALATLALARSPAAPLAAGLAAAWRPELMPWAALLGAGSAFAASWGRAPPRFRRIALAVALSIGPALLVALLRYVMFGRAGPLALLAKPSDLEHGTRYAFGALLLSGPAWLIFAPLGVRRLDAHERVVLVACVVHFVALALAGGDWMALWRLAVPVLPGFVLIGAALAERTRGWATLARLVAALAVSIAVFATYARQLRSVGGHRRTLIEQARPALASARRVATLDAGWVGAATAAPVVDLAGLTDPIIAALPGGHTSKHLPRGMLEARGVDTLVLLLAPDTPPATPWQTARFDRIVEQRLALILEPEAWRPVARLPLGGTRQGYVVLRAVDPS